LDHAATRYAVTAERTALGALGGGCQVPIGVHCAPAAEADTYSIAGVVAAPEGGQGIRVEFEHQKLPAAELGQRLAEELLRQGARSILEAMAL
jgi:hydroxymethylbilane synthase